jgi:ParB-like chromosome segregation protein Spo0J
MKIGSIINPKAFVGRYKNIADKWIKAIKESEDSGGFNSMDVAKKTGFSEAEMRNNLRRLGNDDGEL